MYVLECFVFGVVEDVDQVDYCVGVFECCMKLCWIVYIYIFQLYVRDYFDCVVFFMVVGEYGELVVVVSELVEQMVVDEVSVIKDDEMQGNYGD